MEKNKPVSFKDNMYRMFLRYAVAPAFGIAFAGVFITFGFWGYSTIDSTKKANEDIGGKVVRTIEGYEQALIVMEASSDLVTKPIDRVTRVSVFEDVYKLSNKLGYKAKIYVFNKDYEPVIMSNQEVPSYLKSESVANWGIFRLMNNDKDATAIKVMQDMEGQSSSLLIGRTIKEGNEAVGYVIFSIDSSEFQVLLTKVSSQTIITDTYGWIYLANNYDFSDNLNRMSRKFETQEGYIKCNGKNFYMESSSMMDDRLRIYTVSDVSSQLAAFKWVGLLLTMMFVVILFSLLKGADKTSAESTRDIDIIANAFEQVQEGNLDNYISICSSKEFQTIGNSYNLMIDSLKEQIEKNKEMIAHMAFAQIKQLESQINPHFLFNTLENIRIMCKLDTAKADKMIVNLSSILRYSISNADEDVTVRQDMKNTEQYLSILKMRFNRRFRYSVDIEEEVMDLVIPKLLIQPLIENAIKYGFEGKEVLTVEIRGYRDGNNLIFICRDDGTGIEAETLKELKHTLASPKNRSSHLGLYNIHKRINLKYKGNYGVAIESEPDKGTTLTLTLPAYKRGS